MTRSVSLGRQMALVVLASVVDAKNLDCVLLYGERDQGTATESERAQARSQIIPGDTPQREVCKAIAVVKDRGDLSLGAIRKSGLLGNPEIEIGELQSGSGE